jgi:hypothetical protein
MSKQQALRQMSARAEELMRRDLKRMDDTREDIVRAWQQSRGLTADGWPGSATLSALWSQNRPSADDIVAAARAALDWPPVTYSMSRNTGLGESWLPDLARGHETGDCSDFACHCLGIPKDQTRGLATVASAFTWVGADSISAGHIGQARPLADTQPGDLVVFPGKWERGERVAIGHVEVCVEVRGDRIVTVGCASSNGRRKSRYDQTGSAIAAADKTDRWRRKSAVAVRPWWNA